MAMAPYTSGGPAGPSGTPFLAPSYPGSALPMVQVAVWEWLDEFGHWRPYSGRVSSYIEHHMQHQRGQRGGGGGVSVVGSASVSGPASSSISLGQADPSLAPYIIDIPNQVQFRQDTGTMRSVRRKLFPQSSAMANGVLWEWVNDDGSWTAYEMEICVFLENSYTNRQSSADLMTFNIPYVVDLTAMFQINRNTSFRRQVRRRTDGSYPTVAAMTCSCQQCQGSSGTGPILSRGRHSLGHPPLSGHAPVAIHSSQRTSVIVSSNSNFLPYSRRPVSVGATPSSGPSSSGAWGITQSALASATSAGLGISNGTSIPSLPLQSQGPINSAIAGMTAILMSAAGLPVCFSHTPKLASTPASSKKKNASIRKSKKMSKKVAAKEPEEVVTKYIQKIENPADEDCIICMEKLASPSGYDGVSESKSFQPSDVGKLMKCNHIFHLLCVLAMYDNGNKDGSLQCPSCKTIYGEKTGTQPKGRMDIYSIPQSLPGHNGCGTIQIVYNISSGIQGPEHPNPGKPYTARGFPRICYLPDNEKGRKVLELLKVAWNRRLIFAVGTSSTTGEANTVVWNEIHHKTEMGSNASGHGYPDPNYLDNVLAELAAQGVTEDCLTQNP